MQYANEDRNIPNSKNKITIFSGTYNEQDNVEILCSKVKLIFSELPQYEYEQIIIDNCSTDLTVEKLRALAANDKKIKVIVNSRNFGAERSGGHGIRQCYGDAVVVLPSDMQDPAELIPEFLKKWESGYKIVMGVTNGAPESWLMSKMRRLYYYIMEKTSERSHHIRGFSGFGLYDKMVIDALREVNDPNPYFRGLISEIGYPTVKVQYDKKMRARGVSSNNIFSLYKFAMLGLISQSMLPLRLATMLGFGMLFLCIVLSGLALIFNLLNFDLLQLSHPILFFGIFFVLSIQMIFLGLIGEYVGLVLTQVKTRPLVFEKERINF